LPAADGELELARCDGRQGEGGGGESGPGAHAADTPIRVTRATLDQAWARCHLEQVVGLGLEQHLGATAL
jgi:hypothetical protein